MKALIRNPGETVPQDMSFTFINWNTGAPLTNPDWYGGPYTLVNDYVPEVSMEGPETRSSESEGTVTEPLPETVSYGGKEYTLEELKKLIG